MDVETMVGPIPENEAYNPCAATTCMRGWSCVPVVSLGCGRGHLPWYWRLEMFTAVPVIARGL